MDLTDDQWAVLEPLISDRLQALRWPGTKSTDWCRGYDADPLDAALLQLYPDLATARLAEVLLC